MEDNDKATQKKLERLVGRAVINPEFRASLLSYPQETAAELGVELSEEGIRFVQELDAEALENLAEQVKEIVQMASAPPGLASAAPGW
jgi:hypothetical protein